MKLTPNPTPQEVRSLQEQLRNERARANRMHLALLEARDTLYLTLVDYSGLEKGAENGQSSYWSNRRRIIERAHQATFAAIGID